MNLNNRTSWTHLKLPNITVSVEPRPGPKSAIFQVATVIDNGRGRRRAVLKDPEFLILETEYLMEPKSLVPPMIGTTQLLYTGRFGMYVPNPHKALAEFYRGAKVEEIVPDVLQPGDFMIFRKAGGRSRQHLITTLRVMTRRKAKQYQNPYAV